MTSDILSLQISKKTLIKLLIGYNLVWDYFFLIGISHNFNNFFV